MISFQGTCITSNLRYLRYGWLIFPGIGKLKFLQELVEFSINNEIGYRIGELELMNDVRILSINQLENVRNVEEVCKAKLFYKRKLTELSLKWSGSYFDAWIIPYQNISDRGLEDVKVLDNLQPHNYLKKLCIINYMGVRSAIWMNKAQLIGNLEEIHLGGCLEWQILPPFGQLPFLKILSLHNMPKVK